MAHETTRADERWLGCTVDGERPALGALFRVQHTRKGEFKGRTVRLAWPWVTVEITEGVVADRFEDKGPGETILFRAAFASMTWIGGAQGIGAGTLRRMDREDALYVTSTLEECPEGWDDDCECGTCMAYAAEDGERVDVDADGGGS
jgi:hypothetical protein